MTYDTKKSEFCAFRRILGDPISNSIDVAYTPLATRLARYYGLLQDDVAHLDTLPFTQADYVAGQSVVARGDPIEDVYLMISGWAARVRYTPSGSRQIIHILLPGDLITGEVFVVRRIDHELISLTNTSIRIIKPQALLDLFRNAPSLSAALWWTAEQEDGMLREQIVRLGRRSALERTAHLLLELHRRLLMVQQATDEAFILPLNQEHISDVLGLSVVHINRTLKRLERSGHIERRGSVIRLKGREKLAGLCDFDLAHFHLDSTLSQIDIG